MAVDDEETVMDTSAPEQQFSSGVNLAEFQPIEIEPMVASVSAFDRNGPRLMISHIVNENFKSYAGVQTLGPFHKSFSSIVGPNGSGKSNVIDSMLFVFGYRANKIRSKKISVLLHNSENHKNITSCTVSVHFQRIIDKGPGDDEYDVVTDSKFVVSRTAYKDNTSTYHVDGRKMTYKEVTGLLRGHGIDLDHNRFLILQGEVEQIAMMKPKAQNEHEEGMLEYLEDIIGSNRYKEPIEILSKRVEQLNELRGEKLNRVKSVEKEKEDLEGTKDEAIKYLSLENDLTMKKNMLYQKYIHLCSENESKASAKLDEIKDSMKELNEKLATFSNCKKEKAKQHKKLGARYEELAKTCDIHKEKFAEFEQLDVKCRADTKHSKGKLDKLDKSLKFEMKKLEELKKVPEKSEHEVEELKVKLKKLEEEKKKEEENLEKVMSSLKTETQGLQTQKEKLEEKLLVLQKDVNSTKSKYDVAQSELDIYLSNQKRETAKLEEYEKNYSNAMNTIQERKESVQMMEKKIPETENTLSKARKDLESATKDEAKFSKEVTTTRMKVEEARSSMSASKSRNKIVEALMKETKAGRLPGVFGRLGDLGAIDAEYDVAVSNACGPLDNILVDCVSTAQRCVEFLKKNNLGVCTFLSLETVTGKWGAQASRKIKAPENVPRLFDLIRVKDEKYKPAFYYGLKDTLVAKDIGQASRIGYGATRWRVVTLAGELIELTGTMTGGGNAVVKGRMGSCVVVEVDPRNLEKLEKKLEKDSTEAKNCQESKLQLEEMVQNLSREVTQMKHTLQKNQMEIKALSEQEASLKEQIKEQKQRVKSAAPDEKQLKQLQTTVQSYKKDYDKAASAASEVEIEAQRLHKEIMDIGGSKLKAVQSRLNLAVKHCDEVTGNITKCGVAVKTAQRNTKKAEDKIENVEEEIRETKVTIEELEKQFQTIEDDASKILELHQEVTEQIKEVEGHLNSIQEEISNIEAEETDFQKDQIEVKHEVEKYETVVKENNQKIRHWKKELGKLTLHKVDLEEPGELVTITVEDLTSIDKEQTQYEITVLEEKITQMTPNMAAIAEYRKKEEIYLKRVGELDEITDLRDRQRKNHEDLRKQRLDEFMAGFSVITNKLKEMYQMITLGGDAELELVDSLDPFSEGIVFSVRPPKKSWKNISNLSGGEKTLSSLALVFALHHYKPTPLYVMDEIDAALDFKNVSIVANYIKERTKDAQFIIISLRNNMFELADRLIGIFKTDNCTKSVTLNPQKISTSPLKDVTNASQS